ncbi:hypothetical protein CJA_2511 [Cellvibrio japonicus Ueda107]|uniref:Uncharacterized protein n=1 Tax=Cellvibrio japonicus (strain Ueda107) TaxID=498211 RepID=B3PKZ9_CELJU|nr:hypothetical protein CJA_2511 [Cellvibrio japonicus Ueda107]
MQSCSVSKYPVAMKVVDNIRLMHYPMQKIQ